jgi:isorenieratene synthase
MLGFRRTAFNKPDPKRPRILPRAADIAIAGGGIAGIAAATILAERGARVTLLEPDNFLGGRAASWPDQLHDGTPIAMERGFHAFFRQYYNLRALLRRIDPDLARLVPVDDYPLLGPDGLKESFAGLPRLPILNLVSLVRRSTTMTMRDALRVDDTLGRAMMAYDPDATYADFDRTTAREFLDRLGFPPRARQMLFDVFAHSFFNPEDEFSAAELIMMFHFYFLGNPEGIVFDLVDGPFGPRLWQPMQRHLEARGAVVRLGAGVEHVARAPDGRYLVTCTSGQPRTFACDALVLATDVPGLHRLLAASPALGDPAWRARVGEQAVTRPFAVWRLWLDTPTAPGRAPFVGTTGLGLLDNISLYHLFEDESRRWAALNHGAVVELHAYALPPDPDPAEIQRDLLAGDHVHTPFPSALMERAASTGILAANHLLNQWGAAEEPLHSVVPRGVLARLIHRRRAPA